MKKLLILIFYLLFLQTMLWAQKTDTIFLITDADSVLTDTIIKRMIGNEILKRSVSLSNSCTVSIEVKLSANNKSWKQFYIAPIEEKLFVIGSLDKIYLWIDPENNPLTKIIIYKGYEYEIRWSSMDKNYMLKQR